MEFATKSAFTRRSATLPIEDSLRARGADLAPTTQYSRLRQSQRSPARATLRNCCGHDRRLNFGRGSGCATSQLHVAQGVAEEHDGRQPRRGSWQGAERWPMRFGHVPVAAESSSERDGGRLNIASAWIYLCVFSVKAREYVTDRLLLRSSTTTSSVPKLQSQSFFTPRFRGKRLGDPKPPLKGV